MNIRLNRKKDLGVGGLFIRLSFFLINRKLFELNFLRFGWFCGSNFGWFLVVFEVVFNNLNLYVLFESRDVILDRLFESLKY